MKAELYFRLLPMVHSLGSYELQDECRRIIYTIELALDDSAARQKSEGSKQLAALLASTNRSLGQVGRHAREQLRSRARRVV